MIRRHTQAVYVISVAAELAGMHPQTLRIYERRGLVRPARTQGGNRRYSDEDIEVLRRISRARRRRHEPRGHPPRDGAGSGEPAAPPAARGGPQGAGPGSLVPIRQPLNVFGDRHGLIPSSTW